MEAYLSQINTKIHLFFKHLETQSHYDPGWYEHDSADQVYVNLWSTILASTRIRGISHHVFSKDTFVFHMHTAWPYTLRTLIL